MTAVTTKDAKIDAVRAQMPAMAATGYFNTGSFGPMPTVAFEAAEQVMRADLEQGRIVPGGYAANRDRNRMTAALAAEIFGADPDEIALTHSTCEGLNTALMGMTWDPGDEVVTTSEEHPGLLLPLALLARRQGVVTRSANIGNGGQGVIEAIEEQITARTRAIALSHVLWSTGAVLPLREVCDLARDHELLVIVDAAQSAGQIPVDLHALGVDAYAMAGQKWLCGPEATGFLYIRRDRFPDIAPTYARYGQFDPSGYFFPGPGASRYEIGEFSGPAVAAQEAGLHWLRDDVGLDWAYARTAMLGARFRALIDGVPAVKVITPVEAMAGLVNFTIEGLTPQEVTAAIYERGYTIRYVDTAGCCVSVRAAIGWWNTEEEVDGLAQAVTELAASAGASRE